MLETPQQLQPHVSIYISLDLTVQLSKTKLILSLIGLEHPGSGPQHFTSAALHLPHCLPAPNFPALGSVSSTWLYIILETSKLVRSLLHSKSSYESHLLPHEIYTLDRMEKGPCLPCLLGLSQLRLLLLNKCTRCSKSKRQLKGPSTPPRSLKHQ